MPRQLNPTYLFCLHNYFLVYLINFYFLREREREETDTRIKKGFTDFRKLITYKQIDPSIACSFVKNAG